MGLLWSTENVLGWRARYGAALLGTPRHRYEDHRAAEERTRP